MTNYQRISYDKKHFYIDLDQEDLNIYNQNFEKLNSSQITNLSFKNTAEFHLFLTKLFQKPKTQYLDESSFGSILSQNLTSNGLKLSAAYMRDIMPQVNYKIIKKNDIGAILDCLDLITRKNKFLEYFYVSLDLNKKITLDKGLKQSKYFKEPYGRISNTVVYGIPLIFPKQMEILLKLETKK